MHPLRSLFKRVLSIFGYSLPYKFQSSIFKLNDLTPTRVQKLKHNLDNMSCKIIDALIYLAYNPNKKIYKNKNLAFFSRWRYMKSWHKYYYRYKYKIPANIHILEEVFYQQCGLKYLDKKILKYIKGKSSITAGAYYGDSPLALHNITKGKVYGFEPNKNNFSLFKNILAKNKGKEDFIFPIYKGLDKSSGYSYINDNGFSIGSNISDNTEHGTKIEVTSIDDFIEANDIKDLGVIHLDIEGLETAVIEGSKKVITKYKPVLLLSIYHNPKDFFDLKPLIESWNLDYNFKIRKLIRTRFELMLIATPKI